MVQRCRCATVPFLPNRFGDWQGGFCGRRFKLNVEREWSLPSWSIRVGLSTSAVFRQYWVDTGIRYMKGLDYCVDNDVSGVARKVRMRTYAARWVLYTTTTTPLCRRKLSIHGHSSNLDGLTAIRCTNFQARNEAIAGR